MYIQLRGYHGPKALVVAPTRELAIQIETETRKFAYCMGVSVSVVYGGAPRRQQEKRLRSGMQFLIATPGRLLDFLVIFIAANFYFSFLNYQNPRDVSDNFLRSISRLKILGFI